MATRRKPMTKKHLEEKLDKAVYAFTEKDEKKDLSGSEEEGREDETHVVDKMAKKRSAAGFEEEAVSCAVGNEVQSMLEKFGADISKVMQAKKKRLECLTKNYMKGSQQKLEQLWSNHHGQRKKATQQYSQQVSSALQQWEDEAQRAEEQEEKLNNLFRQQQKILQQARVVQNQKLKAVRDLYEQFVKYMDNMEKNHETFLQGAQQELRKEMATLQKKILMDIQQQEMATVRKSLHSMLF
ncbi:synaptonemal complex protein 3 [Nothobranchius furzeri]|uniref:Synaptonemal complex protein 3 n=1 Tax=Nothobranchius furzeri TaxID=105023 RepID=A0A1A8B7P1_NOTFU|nr:synaptonemal complex protein 3 [Nothobranchius furzeri]XP_015820594.1 synaptonemal complex protein 3 [Nothobranchius furzeri]KAF7224967.1 transcript variant X2 [Nothobranchius furzeri]KAF7224968.1 transcript variant X1 [Nothobranchius furzeri]